MPRPKRLSGADIITILKQFGFDVVHKRGSHVKMIRVSNGEKQTLTVTTHKELKTGTVVGIFRQASRYIPESELREHFYNQ